MYSLAIELCKDLVYSSKWTRNHIWTELLHQFHDWEKEEAGAYLEVTNERHLLGRLYGYAYAQTEGTGIAEEKREDFTYQLLSEYLLQPNVGDRISVFTKQNDPDFSAGVTEGKRNGDPYRSEDDDDGIWSAMYEAIHGKKPKQW